MIGKTKKILIIGSAPDSVNATKWKNISFDKIVAINNAWKVRKDWTNCIYPEDFPENKRPKSSETQTLHSSEEYVKAQNHFGGFVYAGGTMAFTAGYWVLYKFKPQIICYTGCDMVYTGEKTHFYGKGKADPLRKDKTLNNLLAIESLPLILIIVSFVITPMLSKIMPKKQEQEEKLAEQKEKELAKKQEEELQ